MDSLYQYSCYSSHRYPHPSVATGTTNPYNDTVPVPTITPGTASATDGTSTSYVTLSLSGQQTNLDKRYFKCYVSATGASSQYSSADEGWIGVGSLTYQWKMSDADSDANYNTNLGTTVPYNATNTILASGAKRYFLCAVSATGATTQNSNGNEGFILVIQVNTMTFYPDADPESTSVDGSVEERYEIIWANLRNAVGSDAFDTNAEDGIWFDSNASDHTWYDLGRDIILFDTSALDIPGISIETATLSLYGSSKDDSLSVAPNINIYTSNPASNTALAPSDYSTLGDIALSDPISYADWSVLGYNNFVINDLTKIATNGVSKFGVRNANYDVANIEPAWTPNSGSFIYFWFSEKGDGYKPKLTVTYTLVDTKDFGSVSDSTTYYAKGSAPNNPVQDSDCTFTLSNDSNGSIKVLIKGSNFVGGVGWTLVTTAPGADEVKLVAYYSGQNPTSGVVLTTSDQTFISSLAVGTIKWDFSLTTGINSDGTQKTGTITLTGVAP